MSRMFRIATFLPILLVANVAAAQVPPPGDPFDAARHPNPIITFVESKDFKPIEYDKAKRDAGIDVLGLSQPEGKPESLEMADGKFVKNMSIIGRLRTDATFYPVLRQTFKLSNGNTMVLHSFRFPKVALPPEFARFVLNEASVQTKKKPSEMRFGGRAPEQLDIRGTRGLLFENDGEITIYWEEDGVGHTVTSKLPRKELFRIVEDLL